MIIRDSACKIGSLGQGGAWADPGFFLGGVHH